MLVGDGKDGTVHAGACWRWAPSSTTMVNDWCESRAVDENEVGLVGDFGSGIDAGSAPFARSASESSEDEVEKTMFGEV